MERLEERVVHLIDEIAGEDDTRRDDTWEALQRTSESQPGSALVDLVWSLACEQHPDWRQENYRKETADATFEALVNTHLEAIEAFVLGRLSTLGADGAMDVAIEALARAFEAYWSESASRPFRGGSRIRTLLCTIAHREGLQQLRLREREIEYDPVGHDRAAEEPFDGADFSSTLARAMEECLDELPPKRQLVATKRWRDDARPSEIAESLGLQRPAVSNHLNKAKPALAACLRGKGVVWEAAE